jgi:hypothetical protein
MISYTDKRQVKTTFFSGVPYDTYKDYRKVFKIFGKTIWSKDFVVEAEYATVDLKRPIGLRSNEKTD